MTIWVIDTSSIIEIKRSVPNADRKKLFAKLTELVNNGTLVYPRQVVEELGRYVNPNAETKDEFFLWADSHKAKACIECPYDVLKEVLANPIVQRVLDTEKTGVEEADPYVLALAAHIRKTNNDVVVITEERINRPDKISMSTACGVLRLVRLGLIPFLEQENIWRPS